MKPKLDRYDALAIGVLAGTVVITAALYGRLPDRIPVHFDWHGAPDRFGDRSAAWHLCAIAPAVWALVRFGGLLLPRAWRERMESSPLSAVGLALMALLAAMQLVVLHSALRPEASAGAAVSVALGSFWVVLGQLLPRVRRNPFIGIRVTWTLTSDENWLRTHRFAGWTCTLGGLCAILAGILGAPGLALTAVLTSALVPVGYSFVLARRLQQD